MPQDNQAELFYLVDEHDQVIGSVPRHVAHSDPSQIHRAVTILLLNSQDEVLLQQRSLTKDTCPGFWDISTSGHVTYGQTYDQAATKELEEEVGIQANLQTVGKVLVRVPTESEYVMLYLGHTTQTKIQFDSTEVATTQWLPFGELTHFIDTHDFAPISKSVLTQLGYLPNHL